MAPALLFDLDGTLVDTATDLAMTLNRLLAECGYPTLSHRRIRRFVGGGARGIVRGGLRSVGGPADEATIDAWVHRFLAVYDAAPAANSHPFPGARELVPRLHADGWRLGVCTNKPQLPADHVVDHLGLAGAFGAVVGGDAVAAKKPDPGHIDAVLARLNAGRADAVLVGDSRTDLDAARNAGIPVVLVTHGYTEMPVTGMGADRVITHFDALPAALDALGACAGTRGSLTRVWPGR